MLDELPALIATGYEDVPEEDIVRLKWWGLYHDKPKIGTFMLRSSCRRAASRPRSCARSASSRTRTAAARASSRPGRRSSSTTSSSRRCPRCSPARRGRADDRRRLRRRGPEHHGLPRRRPRPRRALRRDAGRRRGDGVLLRQPRLLRPAAQAQDLDLRLRRPLQRAGDQLHLARRRDPRRRARASRCSSAAGSRPCRGIARDLGVFVREDEAMPVLRALLDAWKEDLRYRVSRVKARMKFMVDDSGPKACARRSSAGSATRSPDYALAAAAARGRPPGRRSARARTASSRSACRCTSASSRATRWSRVAELAAEARRRRPRDAAAEPRRHRRPRPRDVERGRQRSAELGFPLDGNGSAALDRLHRRAALQLLRHRDEDAARHADRASRGTLRRRDRRAAAAPRRLPARVRPALGRRHRLPGHDRARRGGQAAPGLRHLPARRPRPRRGDRPPGVPPRPDRGARRDGRRPDRRLARRSAPPTRASARSATADRRRARRPGRARAGEEPSRRGGAA